ncbi:flippase [Vibrio splendidus]|uniref:flippase n=1 Tax=Vibrio splendidus TaxID=29497 RepID=UPI0022365442|nr:flippase [Vibrio splendidus]MCW4446344.1 flippase [Vibrio splendidus]
MNPSKPTHISIIGNLPLLRSMLKKFNSEQGRNALSLILEKILLLGLGFLFTMLLARSWSPEILGEFQYLIALVALLTPFSALGLNSLVSRELVLKREGTGQILGTALTLRVMGAAISGLIMALVALFLIAPEHQTAFFILLGAQLAHGFSVFDFYFESKVQSWVSALLRTCNGFLFMALKLGWVWWHGSLAGVLMITAVEWLSLAVGWFLVFRATEKKFFKLSFCFEQAKALLRRAGWLVLSGIAAVIYLKIDIVMLGSLADKAEVAGYSLAARLSEVWYIFPSILAATWFPSLIKARKEDYPTYIKKLQKLCDLLAWCAIAIAVIMTLIAKPLMGLVFGDIYYEAGGILQIHIWAAVFIFMRALFSKWILVEDITKYSLITHGAGAIMNLVLNLWWIPLWGGQGAAMATLVSYATASFFALLPFSKTRPFAVFMAKSLVLPVRVVFERTR